MNLDPTSEQGLGFLLSDVSRLMRRNFDRRVQPLGLTLVQWRALAQLSRSEGTNQAALAEMLEVKPVTAARLVDRLQASGWVERRPDPDDRRAVRLYLTPKAAPLVAEMYALGASTRAEALAGLDHVARAALIAGLHRVKDNLLRAESEATAQGAGGG